MRLQIWLLVLIGGLGLAFLGASCSEEVAQERSASACTDGQDNDGDGLVDCDDPDCRARPQCSAPDGGTDGGADSGQQPLADGPLSQQEPNDGAAAQ